MITLEQNSERKQKEYGLGRRKIIYQLCLDLVDNVLFQLVTIAIIGYYNKLLSAIIFPDEKSNILSGVNFTVMPLKQKHILCSAI